MRIVTPIVLGLVLYLVWQGRARAMVRADTLPPTPLPSPLDILKDVSPVYLPPSAAEPFRPLLDAAEAHYGLPRYLLYRQAQKESGFNPRAVNTRSGAQGIMQILPATARDPGFGVPAIRDPFDPAQAIPFAASYLAAMYRIYGDWGKALAAYNWGPGNVSGVAGKGAAWLSYAPSETRDYVAAILRDVG